MSGQLTPISLISKIKEITPGWFLASFMLSILIQFPVSAQFPLTLITYALLFPSLICMQIFYPERMRPIWKSPLCIAFIGLFAFVILHTLFLTSDHAGMAKTLINTVDTAAFLIAACVFFLNADDGYLRRFLKILSYLAGLCAFISIIKYYRHGAVDEYRLVPIGRAHHEILGALSYGIAGFAALAMVEMKNITREKAGHALSILCISLMIILTRSRMPMLAYAFCLGLGGWRFFNPAQRLKIMAVAIGTAALLMTISGTRNGFLDFMANLLAKKDGFRLELWKTAYGHIMEHPWAGSGMRAILDNDIAYSPHNIYIATAYYIGIPAALWFIATVLVCVGRGIKMLANGDVFEVCGALMLFQGVFSALTEHGQLVKTPGPLWLIFWMPIGFIIAKSLKKTDFPPK